MQEKKEKKISIELGVKGCQKQKQKADDDRKGEMTKEGS